MKLWVSAHLPGCGAVEFLDFMFQWQQSDRFPFCFINNCAVADRTGMN